MKINDYIVNKKLKVLAKPNSPKTAILSYNQSKQALRIAIAAIPDKDKANQELLKFLKKLTGRRCKIKSGSKSREKVIEFV
ncbi:DUF167 domain-containing protein [Nanoarchaeota archaeon]